jgi:hypothetical protein
MQQAKIELALEGPGVGQAAKLIVDNERVVTDASVVVTIDRNVDVVQEFSATGRYLSSWNEDYPEAWAAVWLQNQLV